MNCKKQKKKKKEVGDEMILILISDNTYTRFSFLRHSPKIRIVDDYNVWRIILLINIALLALAKSLKGILVALGEGLGSDGITWPVDFMFL